MMGRSHALSGWCAGLVVAPLIGLTTVAEVVPFAAATAGYALCRTWITRVLARPAWSAR